MVTAALQPVLFDVTAHVDASSLLAFPFLFINRSTLPVLILIPP